MNRVDVYIANIVAMYRFLVLMQALFAKVNLSKSTFAHRCNRTNTMTSIPFEAQNQAHIVETSSALRVLIVEDEIRLSRFISMVLQHAGYETAICKNVSEARQVLTEMDDWNLVLTDLVMPHENGLELVAWLTQHCPDLPVVIMTAYSNRCIEAKAAQMGVPAVLLKPFTLDALRDTVAACARTATAPHQPVFACD
ncbi:MAG: response regulator [Caldilineaceae bacterium]